ncbi:6-carboxytetrahydropterin synthase [Malaciobacter marinus]|jgi:6-pyruvoyltetrahydropterin/6-carboxytetrahydropterin synthase|uniref:6-carboxy-5,6,7,8-tetrahydropterin synthase n=1 Tax=Malaciobacter marinus TaxID=505249 RepID=A0A347THS5_9BACT|nr:MULTISPECIES: 6-carboxytetrahydropterin synthase [Malaciobacter]AXX86153.1 6-carboxy-5,6,7,8-tetrahydropterin synthase [Malaciobacter marinus]PHO13494.1 6-pyruvoyl tetrahydrobiopterin synthase [Malaciobacter marinus]PHO14521.1 6-pyruvoyl tetrahydrobiopterin synthase [Malaciobacter marinus]RYA23468.1 6-carboxytetrahydropterin synthase [Malaciobacter halophilus]
MHWKISKEFDFCYGHRVWSQTLNTDFSLDGCLKCRHLHGHQGKILVYLEAKKLKDGMVTDFKHLNWFKSFIDDVLDHKFILDINDPLFETLLPKVNKKNLIKFNEGYYLVDLSKLQDEENHIIELYEGYVLVDFVPTSENLSAWFLEIVQEKMNNLGIKVSHVEFLETPKSKSTFYA